MLTQTISSFEKEQILYLLRRLMFCLLKVTISNLRNINYNGEKLKTD